MKIIEPMCTEQTPRSRQELIDLLNNKDYIFEFRWVGERCIATFDKGTAILRNRSGQIKNAQYPELVQTLHLMAPSHHESQFIIDGEIVIFDEHGPSFNALQRRINLEDPQLIDALSKTTPVVYFVFDLLKWGDRDYTNLPIETRRQQILDWFELKGVDPHAGMVQYSLDFDDGLETYRVANKYGYEGIIAKKRGSLYQEGKRSNSWIKIKVEEAIT